MILYAYRGIEPNFGDELNHWLMPRVFQNFFDDGEDKLFIGIGSAIFDHHSPDVLKIVFGTGYGGYTALPKIDDNWHIFCVRGPLTAKALKLDACFVAGDAAILVHDFRPERKNDRVKISFIPHFESAQRGRWKRVCGLAGLNFIDPREPVERVMEQIEDSRFVITEAMHGAIVADALRVPWVAVLPFDQTHRMKWDDWAGALDMQVRFQPVAPSSGWEAYFVRHRKKWPSTAIRRLLRLTDFLFVYTAARSLRKLKLSQPSLSSDVAFHGALQRLKMSAAAVKEAYGSKR